MDPEQLIVRAAMPADTSEVIRLAALMYESMGVDASGLRWRRSAAEAVTRRLGDDAAVFVADDPVRPGGLAACGAGTIAHRMPGPSNPDAAFGYIQWISTDPAWRRHGLARRITVALLSWYDQRQVPTVELHATPGGEGIYRALGFSQDGYPGLRRHRT